MSDDPTDRIAELFRIERVKIVRDRQETEPYRLEVFKRQLEPYLKAAALNQCFPLEALSAKQAEELVMALDGRVPGPALISQMNGLELQLHRREAEAVFLLRDGRKPILRDDRAAPETVKALDWFERSGGHYIEMEFEWMADFYALDYVEVEARAGRLGFQAADGSRVILTVEHVTEFKRTRFESGLFRKISEVLSQP
ncbi:MAG: hypothetical protein ACI9R3_005957 [Verrucomicrobiales bacterium]|jgi:hypothetical protein